MKQKYFIITIDTEGDNLWNIKDTERKIKNITNKNGDYIWRFQELCEKYKFIPTYLTNYEMSQSKNFVELARKGIKENTLEIGMHVHAWNSPPYYPLKIWKGFASNSYLGEYPKSIIFEKMDTLKKILQDKFSVEITSHRGGRWYLDYYIVKILEKLGFWVDCTISPGINWKNQPGYTKYSKGSNWKRYEDKPFYFKKGNIFCYEKSILLELPVTIKYRKEDNTNIWLRPNGKNKKDLFWIVNEVIKSNEQYMEFMLHSSELMPGGSPTFRNSSDIEVLYKNMEELFQYISKDFTGIGITDYRKKLDNKNYRRYIRKEV